MLVIRASDGQIRWMNVTDYLKKHGTATKQIASRRTVHGDQCKGSPQALCNCAVESSALNRAA